MMELTFITGTMKSGKSLELIQRIEANHMDDSLLIIKPMQDTRDGAMVRSRASDTTFPAVLIDDTNHQAVNLILNAVPMYDIIAIDEVQFFNVEFIDALIEECLEHNTNIVASGLLADFKREGFQSSMLLMSEADEVIDLLGTCEECDHKCECVTDIMVEETTGNVIREGSNVAPEGAGDYKYRSLCHQCMNLLYNVVEETVE